MTARAACASVPRVEYWVMRVMLHQGRPVQLSLDSMSPGAYVATLALVNTGSLATLPDGSIVEPVEVFESEVEAHAHRERLRHQYPREDFRVVLNADVTT